MPQKKNAYGIPILLLLLSFLVFSNTITHTFTYDDLDGIRDSDFHMEMKNLPQVFSRSYFDLTMEKSYRPVVTISYFIDALLWNKNPSGYHLTNLILHSLVVVLFYFFLERFLPGRGERFFAALLFSFHPVVCEPVNSISFREDILAALFLLPAFLVSFRMKGSGWGRGFLVALLFLLACFSKESALPFIPAILVYCYLFEERKNRSHGFWIPLSGAVLFFIVVRFFLMTPALKEATPLLGGSAVAAASHAGYLFLFAWRLFFFPFFLNADYVFHHIKGAITLQSALGMIFVLLYGVTLYLEWKRGRKNTVFALSWILVFFLPVSNLVPLTNPFAERYLYLPLMGFALLAGVGYGRISSIEKKSPVRLWIYVGILLILVPAALSNRRNLVWSTDETLWSSTLRREPGSVRALNGVAVSQIRRGEYQEAEDLLNKAAAISPDDYEILNNLGLLYLFTGREEKARDRWKRALQLRPGYAAAHYNLARLYFYGEGEGREKALFHLKRAMDLGFKVSPSFLIEVKAAFPLETGWIRNPDSSR